MVPVINLCCIYIDHAAAPGKYYNFSQVYGNINNPVRLLRESGIETKGKIPYL